MSRHSPFALAALFVLAGTAVAQYPGGPQRRDPFGPSRSGGITGAFQGGAYQPHDPPAGIQTRPMRPGFQQFQRNEDERKRNQAIMGMAQQGAGAVPNLKSSRVPKIDPPHVPLRSVPKPPVSSGRGWLAGLGAGIASVFAAIFGTRKKKA